jgi:uncharacterized protein YecE (DUF72 family)
MPTLIGTSGYSYEEWRGAFYPADLPREDFLRYYSMFFPIVELDSTYFRMPEGWRLAQMAETTPKDFLFSIKAPRSFTHEPQTTWLASVNEFATALRVRQFRDRLAAVILQFPPRFQYSDPNRLFLGELTKELMEFPLFLEFRNGQWLRGSVFEEAERRNIGLVSVDAPYLPSPTGSSIHAVGDVAYVRFHGRNVEAWWSGKAEERYDYSYSDMELAGWVREMSLKEKTKTIFVSFNNHPNANAVRDARRLKALLEAQRPRLESFTKNP